MGNLEVISTFLLVLRFRFTVGIVQYPEADIILRHAETKLCLGILNVPKNDPLKYTGKEEVGLMKCSPDSKAQRFYEHSGNDDEVEFTTMLSDTPKKCLGVGGGKDNLAQHDCGKFPDSLLYLKKVNGLDTKFAIQEMQNSLCMEPASDKVSIERAVCNEKDKRQYFERCKGSVDNCDMVWLDKNIIFRNDKVNQCLSVGLIYDGKEFVGVANCTNELTQRFYELPAGDNGYRKYASMIHNNFTLCIGVSGTMKVREVKCENWREAALKLEYKIDKPGRNKFFIHNTNNEFCLTPHFSDPENIRKPVKPLIVNAFWICASLEETIFFKCKNDYIDCGAPWLDKNIVFRDVVFKVCLGIEYDEEEKTSDVLLLECQNDPSQRFYQLPGESENSYQFAHMSQDGIEMCLGVTGCGSTLELLKCNGDKTTSFRMVYKHPYPRNHYVLFYETTSDTYYDPSVCCLGPDGDLHLEAKKYCTQSYYAFFVKCHGDFNKCKI